MGSPATFAGKTKLQRKRKRLVPLLPVFLSHPKKRGDPVKSRPVTTNQQEKEEDSRWPSPLYERSLFR